MSTNHAIITPITTQITTLRLHLFPASATLIRREISDHVCLSATLNARIPAAWPPANIRDVLEFFAQDLDARPDHGGWAAYYWLAVDEQAEPERRVLVGSGGFKSAPDADGVVEVGYGTLDEFQGLGYATEAVQGLVAWAIQQPGVTQVIAHADPANIASVRVLEKSGFGLVGPGDEPGVDRYEYIALSTA